MANLKNDSVYAGFLNGYMAGNLSAHSKELSFHTNQILSFINDLNSELKNLHLSKDVNSGLEKQFDAIENINKHNNVEFYYELGQVLLNIYTQLDAITVAKPTTITYQLNKIIYHYLNIAKTIKISKITKQAKAIVDKFEQPANLFKPRNSGS